MAGSGDLSGDTVAEARGLCEFLVAKTIIQKGQCLKAGCFRNTA